MACRLDALSHYLNQCWDIVDWTLGNKLQWNLNRNLCICIRENTFENIVWEMTTILSQRQCVKKLTWMFMWQGAVYHLTMNLAICAPHWTAWIPSIILQKNPHNSRSLTGNVGRIYLYSTIEYAGDVKNIGCLLTPVPNGYRKTSVMGNWGCSLATSYVLPSNECILLT